MSSLIVVGFKKDMYRASTVLNELLVMDDKWVVDLRNLLAILLGILAFTWDGGITVVVLVLLFNAYAVVNGILALVAANHADAHVRWARLERMAGFAADILTFLWPGIVAFVLLYLISTW